MLKLVTFYRNTAGSCNAKHDRNNQFILASVQLAHHTTDMLLKSTAMRIIQQSTTKTHRIIHILVQKQLVLAVIVQVHKHPTTHKVQHICLKQVLPTQSININLPLKLIKTDKKQQKMNIMLRQTEISVQCMPLCVPDFVLINVQDVTTKTAVTPQNLVLPKGVVINPSISPLAVIATVEPNKQLN